MFKPLNRQFDVQKIVHNYKNYQIAANFYLINTIISIIFPSYLIILIIMNNFLNVKLSIQWFKHIITLFFHLLLTHINYIICTKNSTINHMTFNKIICEFIDKYIETYYTHNEHVHKGDILCLRSLLV